MRRARVGGMGGLACVVLTLGSAALSNAVPAAAAASRSGSTVDWKPCPTYSDEAIASLGTPNEQIPQFRAQMKRLECGTISVPLDYRHPKGRKISIAVTRLGAVDTEHRLGALAMAPGGPGGSGYLDPIRMTLRNKVIAQLNDRYDLIGFDPRGVNYSTKTNCAGTPPPNAGPGPLTKASAERIYEATAADNAACGRSDPAFLGQLTTANVARDLDRVRAAIGERRLNILGFSWGTWLGAVYRSLFPGRTGRVFLDSPAPPYTSFAEHDEGVAEATERDFARMAAWLARYHTTYGLGATAQQVRATVLKLRHDYDANPKTFTDLNRPIDGSSVAQLAGMTSPHWPQAGRALAELRDATSPQAPPTVKEILGAEPPKPVPGAPEMMNMTMNRATICNEDQSRSGFSAAWTAYQQRLKRYPVTAFYFGAGCAGWPLPVQQTRVHRTGGSLVLSGHRYDIMSAYKWTLQMQAAIGGKVYTVDDDVHISATYVPECAADVVAYFTTGRIDNGCDGQKAPTPQDAQQAGSRT
ncbi:alpha/beta hydrolase [Actinoallomurus liliacearum]|uniref:Alpha/beta hydrolase n=1 Tax=Actinoallomurus liliacearum TaxID=1080073 RepID=A0ABP8TDN9_9ACTN